MTVEAEVRDAAACTAGTPEAGRRREDPSPEPSEAAQPCAHLLDVYPPEEQRMRSCCFKPPSLEWFVIAALGRLMQWSTISFLISRTEGDAAIFLIHS